MAQFPFISLGLYSTQSGMVLLPFDSAKPNLAIKFYAITPTCPMLPSGTRLISVQNQPNNMQTIKLLDNPYTATESDEFRFISWASPIPNTVPLYYYQSPPYLSLTKIPQLIQSIPTIYFLRQPKNFVPYQGRCLPISQGGIPLEECVLYETMGILRGGYDAPILRKYLESLDDKKSTVWPWIILTIAIFGFVFYWYFIRQ